MSQIILIEPNAKKEKLLKLNLSNYLDLDVIIRKDAQDCIELLRILPSIDLIITSPEVEDEKTAHLITKHINEQRLGIPIILTKEHQDFVGKVLCLKENFEWELLVKHAANLLGINPDSIQKKVEYNYAAIDIELFYEINQTPCDVYIRIMKEGGDYNYVQRLHTNDSFTATDIDKYKERGLRKLFIHNDYKQYFTTYVSNKIILKLENPELDFQERINTNSVAYSMIQEKIQGFGLDEMSADLANSSIRSMVNSIKENSVLRELLHKLFSDKISFAYQKAHLICVIGDFILSKQSWYKDKHLAIFTFAAFFSDMPLKTKKQMQILSQQQLDESDLSEVEKKEVRYHARTAAKMCQEHPDYSNYIEIILTQHHGVMSGIGFNRDSEDELHPISKVFMVADHFVTHMLTPGTKKEKKYIINMLEENFKGESYEKILSHLQQKMV